jgi:hypothetical protein
VNNVVAGNGAAGLRDLEHYGSGLVRQNYSHDNGQDGVVILGNGITVSRNSVVGNPNGLTLYGGSSPMSATQNYVSANRIDGIIGYPGFTGLLESNVTNANGQDGIHMVLAQPQLVTLTANVANANRNLGIDVTPGVVNGGGNRAAGNGNPAQCAGVACSP